MQELKVSTPFPVTPIKVDADTTTRASAITGYFEAGKIFLPEGASWAADLEDESAAFPAGVHDDQVDSVSQAINFLLESGGVPGFLLYLQGLAKGIFKLDPEPELSVPAVQQVDQHASELARAREEATNRVSNPFLARAASQQSKTKPPCPKSGTTFDVIQLNQTEWLCRNDQVQWGAPTGQQYVANRTDLFEGRVNDVRFHEPGAPRRGRGRG